MRRGGKICLSTGNRKCKGPEAGKSAGGTVHKVSKRERSRDKGVRARAGRALRMGQGHWVFIQV